MNLCGRLAILIVLAWSASPVRSTAGEHSHALFTAVLRNHVKEGRVDYSSIKNDVRFDRYLREMRNTDPAGLSGDTLLAFWINVYNAFTISVILDNYPLESITDLNTGGMVVSHLLKTTVWDRDFIEISGRRYTLNRIEHEIVRKLGDARIHFALVCAAVGCPHLRAEAYEGGKVHRQLDEQARLFVNSHPTNRFDLANHRVMLSKIFDWYDEDFEKESGSVLQYVGRFLPPSSAESLAARRERTRVSYSEYDWRLNDLPGVRPAK